MIMKTNYFFLLPVSPLPLICSTMSMNLLFSLLMMFKFSLFFPLFMSLFSIFLSSFYWWLSYSKEMNLGGIFSSFLDSGLKLSMILFISSEIFFFFSFFWSYFHYFLSPSMEIGLSWPPTEILSFNFINVPLINTLVLLMSGITVTSAHYFLMESDKSKSMFFLLFTVLLGLLFTILQILEYSTSFFSVSDGSFGTSFFVLTGFHGIHVIIGSIFLLTSLTIGTSAMSSYSSMISFELSSWYWHFVDVVWIFLYFFLYYITN